MLTKTKVIAGRQCPKRLFLLVHDAELAQPLDLAAIRQGYTVGDVARQLFGRGYLIESGSLEHAKRLTAAAIAEDIPTIYEATVAAEGVLVKVDVLSRAADGWMLTEVKASTEIRPYYIEDVAIQAWVLRKAGIPVIAARIAYVDKDFIYQGDGNYAGLFKNVDVTAAATAFEGEVSIWVGKFKQLLSGSEPRCDIGKQCSNPFPCEFTRYCDPYQGVALRPDVIPRIGAAKLADLRTRGILELTDVPDGELNAQQLLVKRAHIDQRRFVSAGLRQNLAALPYPRRYLDFETSNPAIPRFSGMRPYQQIPFQWSCHIERADGHVDHREFLVTDDEDPRERFITSVVGAVAGDGPICVWNAPFESNCLDELARDFPPYADKIAGIQVRIVDLLPLFREHYYDPGMNGSWSIKAVARTVDSELAYEKLGEVQDGTAAMDAYIELVDPATTAMRRAVVRKSLLRYCEHDTLVMLRAVAAGSAGL